MSLAIKYRNLEVRHKLRLIVMATVTKAIPSQKAQLRCIRFQ